jgi:hypothetical protein
MRPLLLLVATIGAGCLDAAATDDAAASAVDMRTGPVGDLFGVDLFGAYHCGALNACEKACKNSLCIDNCRKMSTPDAVQKELALQGCFNQYCPQQSDMAHAICERDANGNFSGACLTCVDNTKVRNGSDCTPASAPECHQCLTPATTCAND